VDPEGKESEGSYHAYFYLARPVDQAAGERIEDLLGPVDG
jgi:hypothetical protein